MLHRTTSRKEKTESGWKEPALKVDWSSPAAADDLVGALLGLEFVLEQLTDDVAIVGYEVHEDLTVGIPTVSGW